jgi:hypothetical protein
MNEAPMLAIAGELRKALQRLDADPTWLETSDGSLDCDYMLGLFTCLDAPPELLSIIGSYGDTLDDKEVLQLLKDWNETGKVLNERQ